MLSLCLNIDLPCPCYEFFNDHPYKIDLYKYHTTLGYYETEEVNLDVQDQADLVPIEGDKILCLKCNKTLANMQSAKQHFNLRHQTQETAYCQVCQKAFKNTHSRNVHIKRHHGVTSSMMKNAVTMPRL